VLLKLKIFMESGMTSKPGIESHLNIQLAFTQADKKYSGKTKN